MAQYQQYPTAPQGKPQQYPSAPQPEVYPGPPQAQPGYPGPPQAQPGYPGPPQAQPGYPQTYPATPPQVVAQPIVVTQPVVAAAPITTTVISGGCNSCGSGSIREDYTACGIILAILFFPLGIICCLLMKERKCGNCGNSR